MQPTAGPKPGKMQREGGRETMSIFWKRHKTRTYTSPSGQVYTLYKDMTTQPHLLIAGATGSGKSVVINGIMHTLLHRLPIDMAGGAQFILIDPKRVELAAYKDLPHTLLYASEPDTMRDALSAAMRITESRYQAMQARGERKYSGSDVYVIIDEWADLYLTDKKFAGPLLQRLAQIGRAARVHVIMATQTPISKVIPTEIKCNFDARVGLRARSSQDSRNIIGKAGLEDLPRYGQGVYMTPEGDQLYNIPMIPDAVTDSLIRYWLAQ